MVFSLALRFLRNREVAEELAQDVFLQCHRQIDRIQGASHATSWLRRAICHRSIDELRKRRFRPYIGLDDIPEPAAAGAMQTGFGWSILPSIRRRGSMAVRHRPGARFLPVHPFEVAVGVRAASCNSHVPYECYPDLMTCLT